MLKKSRTQKGNYNKKFVTAKQFKNSILVEKSHYIRFFCNYMPFCYEQTSPLEVSVYIFGFSLSVLKLFSLSPRKKELFKKSIGFLNSSFYFLLFGFVFFTAFAAFRFAECVNFFKTL